MSSTQRLALVAAGWALTGCGGGTGPTPPPPPLPPPSVATVTVTAPRSTLVVGDSVQLGHEIRDTQGQTVAGKTVTWASSNEAAATVSTSGLARAVGDGDATITGTVDGKSGAVQLAVRSLIVDASRRVTGDVGSAGDTLTATAAGGVSYSLEIPAGALDSQVTLSLTPVSAVEGADFTGGLLGAVQLSPAGLTFKRGVTLRITGVGPLPTGQVAIGFVAPDSGGLQGLLPVRVRGAVATVVVPHFSVVGVATELPTLIAGILPRLDSVFVEIQMSFLASLLAGNASRAEINAQLEGWGFGLENVMARSGNTTVDALDAIAGFALWTSTIEFVSATRSDLGGLALDDPLRSRIASNEFFLANGLFEAIARNNRQCRTLKSFLDLEVVLFWQEQAAALGLDDLDVVLLDGIPDLARPTVLGLVKDQCLAVVQDAAQLAEPLLEGVPSDLTMFYKVQFVGQPNRDVAAFGIAMVPGGATLAAPTGFTNASGQYVTGVTATGLATVQILVQACLVLPGQTTATDVCDTRTITRTAQARLRIDDGIFHDGQVGSAYSDQARATGGTGTYLWSLVSGNLPPGLALNAGTGAVGGTPTTAGSFAFRLRVVSGTQSDEADYSISISAPPVGGTCLDVRIDSNAALAAVVDLTCMRNVVIGGFNNRLTVQVALPNLTLIEEAFAVRDEVPGGLSMPALRKLGSGALFSAAKLAVVDLPALTESRTNAGNGLLFTNMADLTTVKLGALTVIEGDLFLRDNPKLTDVSGIRCGMTVTGSLVIQNNPLLPTAAAQSLASCLTVSGTKTISNNKP